MASATLTTPAAYLQTNLQLGCAWVQRLPGYEVRIVFAEMFADVDEPESLGGDA